MPKPFRPYAALAALAPLVVIAASVACSSKDEIEPTDVLPAGDGGTQGADVSIAKEAASDGDVVATAPFHVIGRVDRRDATGPRFSWSGTTIKAKFKGTGVTARIRDTGNDFFDVVIDGAAPKLLRVSAAEEVYELATGLTAGEHDIAITKRTEAFFGTAQLLALEPKDGALVPTPAPSGRRIEMIGDSITCGYGVLGASFDCVFPDGGNKDFSPETESEASAWGALASKELGALRSIVAWSGIGVYRDGGGGTGDQMPVRYDRALADDPGSTWDHSLAPHPDVIVVNLGTNDFATGDPGAAFQTAYNAFLKDLRTKHPDAYIVVATSPMLTDSFPEGEQRRTKSIAALNAIVAARKNEGDAKIGLLELDEQLDTDGLGCDYHPSSITQQKMAAKLVAFVKSALNW